MTTQERFLQGKVLLIDKEYKWTSFDVVNKIRWIINKQLGIKKIKAGHAGTLDPLATGLLIVCTGKATKSAEDFIMLEKEYVFEMKLGETTPSCDLETEVSYAGNPGNVTLEKILDLRGLFTGNILQVPPLFSAKYIGGKRAYHYARKGVDLELSPVQVSIRELELVHFDNPLVTFRVLCSKGTYIRSLVRDIGNELGCGAHLTKLRRTAVGNYHVKDAMRIKEFEENIQTF